LFAALLALTGAQPAWLILAALYCVLFAFTGTDAFAGVAWLDLIGRVYPPDRRGRHIAVWQVLTALCGLGAGALVGLILSERGPAYPYNYALIFAAGGIALLFSLAGLLRVRETTPLAHEQTTALPWRDLIPHVIALWRRDPLLRRVALARVAFSLSAMAHPFFVLYATEVLALPPQTIGLFIAVQTVGALLTSVLMGRLADRHGPQLALQVGVLIVLSAPILALILVFVSLPAGHPLAYVYAWIYVCIGVAGNLIMMGFMNYVLEIAPPDRRPFYFGTANFVNSVGMLGPAIAGWLLTWATYPVLFAVSLGFGLITVLLVFRLPHRNQRESFQQIITH
jgi:MFS family permease